ncbi:MAG: hypothetical protein UR18_C0006G0050 [Candidatus Nomurabacteria bacterium GW2011_GWE2_31_40]|nr:MAG: hypothetical protein UR18_C0006G0050 [Candidatus Nomurabacteria bacterium GW2011_GWE2_31_40]OGU63623.1 MAG: hypothetical protein A2X62_02445 [Stygiobacter sp. GWC2_38_9]OGV06176.1 MAG: hypothetical protein A2299_12120 [Stygiobacter sp. RIFOXYB2_FULL_37_11]OGV15927.1 MAG: hypothetical protein A2440_03055 [Stygiobacter sp. RIFOXYC2_FULL_38_25]OGV80404.1 MAG: hypothetical protein A2X65_04215 [Stygiobacter sp. GWF2_38_21]
MNKNNFRNLLIFIVTIMSSLINISCSKSIPSDIKEIVFEKSQFATPIAISIPCDDSKDEKWVANYCNKKVYYGLDAAPIAFNSHSRMIDDNFLKYLLDLRLVTIKNYSTTNNYGRFEYPVMIYSSEIEKYLVDANIDCNRWLFKFGDRKLKSIEYTNEYEAEPMGMGIEMKIFALTFKYEILSELPNIIINKAEFEGSAKAYLDPDNGKWKLDELKFDREENRAFELNKK